MSQRVKFRRNSNVKQTKGRHEQQYGFMPRKSTTDAGFALRLMETLLLMARWLEEEEKER